MLTGQWIQSSVILSKDILNNKRYVGFSASVRTANTNNNDSNRSFKRETITIKERKRVRDKDINIMVGRNIEIEGVGVDDSIL